MKLLDGHNIIRSSAAEVANQLTNLAYPQSSRIIVTDENGNKIERINLFQETLTDGSKVKTIQIRFAKD